MALENSLLRETSQQRCAEMDKYGRSNAHKRMQNSLKGNRLKGFLLANFGLAIIDDLVDKEHRESEFKILVEVLENSYKNKKLNKINKLSKYIIKLGKILSQLKKEGYIYAEEIYYETIKILKADQRNFSRNGKIFSQKKLDKLNYDFGGSIARQLMYFLFAKIPKKEIQEVADKFGYAVRIADSLSDINEDLKKGIINISKENIKKYKLKISKKRGKNYSIEASKSLLQYYNAELIKVEQSFSKAFNSLNRLIEKYPKEKKKLIAFGDLCLSWLKQAREIS